MILIIKIINHDMKNQLPVCTDNIVHEAFQAEAEAETDVLTHETEVSAS